MDVVKLLRDVKDFKGYVSITEDMVKNIANLKLQFNMTTIHAIKNIQSLELQYFNKCKKTGAASIMFELLLKVPTTKNWNAIGKELVLVIQYWLAGVRKYLITQNEHWWKFMRKILDFIQKLYLKHQSIVNSIVEKTAECLLDLATRTESSTEQRYQILICFNLCCSLAPRELRHALIDRFDKYFIKLALWLPRCGDMFAQYSVLEALMRWLLPRQDVRARELAAARWLPSPLYPSKAVQVFLERPWLSFYRDARSFLNAVNVSGDSVVSILIEKMSLGKVAIVNNRTRSEHWLDLNIGSSTLSVMLDTSVYKAICVNSPDAPDNAAHLLISEGNTATVNMYSGARETMILVKVVDPLLMFPAKILENKHDVRVYVSPKANIQRVDNTLRRIFDKKYQLLRESFSESSQHSADSSRNFDYVSEEDTRFSIPADILRRKLLEQKAVSAQSPSSTSTTSLAMLRERLQDIPDGVFDKEIERIKVNCRLQTVPEVTEKTSHSSLTRPDPSSTDSQNLDVQSCIQSIGKGTDENANNDPSNKHLDIINQLAQEAFEYSRLHASVNTLDHSDIIDNTQSANVTTRSRRCDKREFNRKPALINNFTTTDDSNTAFVENTPAVDISKRRVSNRKARVTHTDDDKTKDSKDSGFGQQVFDNKTVEAFFSKHVAENTHGDLIVSPTLGKRINDSNSNSSSSFTLRPPETESGLNFNYVEVADCLNFVVDKVCENLEKDIENLRLNLNQNNILNSQIEADQSMHLEEITNKVEKNKKKSTRKAKGKTPVIKLKFKNTKKQTKVKSIGILPAIDEKDSDLDKTARSSKHRNSITPGKKSPTEEIETPLNNRKRKLYSKKDDSLTHARTGLHVSETEEDNSTLTGCKPVNRSPISSATPYKELEKMRKKAAARQLRKRKSIVVSPKTENANNLFDRLKDTIESEEKIMLVDTKLVDRGAMYNMSSSSEDDQDFKKKKVVSRKNANSDKPKKTKRSRTKPQLDSNSKDNSNSEQIVVRRTRSTSKQQMHKNILSTEPITDLVDERMREATAEALNTSLVIESREEELNIDQEPAPKIRRIEIVPYDKECEIVSAPMKETKKRNKNIKQRVKGKKNINNNKLVITTDRVDDDGKTISPLPGLEIETAQKIVEPDDSIAMLDKLNDKYEGDFISYDLTQNLLTESEQANVSYNSKKNNTVIETKRVRDVGSRSSDSSNTSMVKKAVVVLDKLDFHFPKSTSNLGRCSDTAHGDILKSPPQVKVIKKRIPRCSVEIEEFSEHKKSNAKKSNASVETERVHSARPSSDISNKSINKNLAVVKDRNAMNTSKSISTVGSCPITAHGDVDESPPKVKEIERTIPRRSLETEEYSESVIDFYNKLTNDLNAATNYSSRYSKRCKSAEKSQTEIDATSSNNEMIEKSPIFKTAIEKSPTVVIRRLSQKDIDSHLIASRNLVFDSPSTSKSEVSFRKLKEKMNDKKSQRLRKSVISPISIDVDMFKSRRLSSEEVRTSPSKKSEPEKSEHSNRYNLRKFGKTYSGKGKSQCTNSALLTQSDRQASVSVTKKQTVDSKNTTVSCEAQPSGSSVNDWFRRNERRPRGNREHGSVNEVLSGVLEKLDTTLFEIHQNTRNSIIKMLAKMKSDLQHDREKRNKAISALLDRMSKEQDDRFIDNLRTTARDIIREENMKKRNLLMLLREDIEAAMTTTENDDND